jgi:hypothetical protein
VAEALTRTEGVTDGVTVIVILLDVAVVGEAQEAVEIMVQLTTSLLESPASV